MTNTTQKNTDQPAAQDGVRLLTTNIPKNAIWPQ
jgi:hypothetical protein